jgi:membrane associated rhomboid family serine protease/Zn-finger nucleic acid-binding protein
MQCPCCSNRLRQIKSGSLIIDVCHNCKGIWFDSGEFVDFVKALSERIKEKESEGISQLFKPRTVQSLKATEQEGYRMCPRCDVVLKKYNYAYDSNVFLDKCTECDGIWTDGGEAQQIAKFLKDDPKVTAIGKDLVAQSKSLQALDDLAELGETMGTGALAFLYLPHIILPLSDDTPRERFPVITISLIALCILSFIGQLVFVSEPEKFLQEYGFIAGEFLSIGLISSMFLHGGLFHLAGNMLFLGLFGDNVEDRFTRVGYLFFYLACGISASILHSFFNLDSSIPAIGASGAISGIMGAYIVFYPSARIKLFFIYRILHLPAVMYLGCWFLFQLIFAILSTNFGGSNIAWFAHIGGFVFGGIFAYFKKKQLAKPNN